MSELDEFLATIPDEKIDEDKRKKFMAALQEEERQELVKDLKVLEEDIDYFEKLRVKHLFDDMGVYFKKLLKALKAERNEIRQTLSGKKA